MKSCQQCSYEFNFHPLYSLSILIQQAIQKNGFHVKILPSSRELEDTMRDPGPGQIAGDRVTFNSRQESLTRKEALPHRTRL